MLSDKIEGHTEWRKEIDRRLDQLLRWLEAHELSTAEAQAQLMRLQQQNRSDKLMVAFVAEFSRGKSELINAIFFAGYGKRIMPARAGRTTMCPTELGYDGTDRACLRLLPIHTRLEAKPLLEWRLTPEEWTQVDLDVHDPDQLIESLHKVADTIQVTVDEARALGFWSDGAKDNPMQAADGSVEVPKWRHALINFDHPLLRQGLVILDTPGLNAIGAEPELTMSLIPQAQTVVFILGADTGVTASDLDIWREYLAGEGGDDASRFVVLNKIDTLWDDTLSSDSQVDEQIEAQRRQSAQILGVREDRVMTVSAKKGLQAKVSGDADMLARSRLPELEQVLGERIVHQRQAILQARMAAGMRAIERQQEQAFAMQRQELDDQVAELHGLMGKTEAAIDHQRKRIAGEQEGFDMSVGRAHALRAVHRKILQEIFDLLGSNQLLKDMGGLRSALQESGFIKLGVRKAYATTFEQLKARVMEADAKAHDMHGLFQNMFKQLNAEFAFTLQADPPPRMDDYLRQLAEIETGHAHYLGMGNLLKLSQPEFVDRLLRALVSRLRIVFEKAMNDIEQWSRSVASQIDTQLRERRRSFKRRMKTLERAESASSDLDGRIQEIQDALAANHAAEAELRRMIEELATFPAPAA